MARVLRGAARLFSQAGHGLIQFIQGGAGVCASLFEQRFAALTRGTQLRNTAVACRTVQAVNAFNQCIVVVGLTRLLDGFTVRFQ